MTRSRRSVVQFIGAAVLVLALRACAQEPTGSRREPAQLVFTAQPTTAVAGAAIDPAVQVTAQDALGNRLTNFTANVTLTITPGTGAREATLSGLTTVAAVAGVATFSTLSIDKMGSGYRLTAAANGLDTTTSTTFQITAGALSASQSTVAASPSTMTAGSGSATITVTAYDANRNPISDATVVLAATGSGNTLTQPASPTNASGVATGTLTSTVAGTKTVSATANGTAITQTAQVTVTPGPVSASQSTVSAAPSSITAGSGTATITVTVKDGNGDPISGATVVLVATGSGNTLTQPGGPTNANGVATGTLRSTVAGMKTVSATANGTALAQTATVTVTPGPISASQSTVSVVPSSIVVTSGTATITVTVKDGNGNPISGATVVLEATGSGNTLLQPGGPTNANGVATGTLSSTEVGTKTVSATANGTALAQTATVTVTSAPVSAALSTVTAAPSSITAGSGTSTITVTVKDENGNPISGATVVLAATGSGNTLTQPAGPTNANGVATGALSSTVAGTKTVSATANGTAITQTAQVTVTPGPISASQSTVSAVPSSIVVTSGTATITVTVKDANGNPISGATVALEATGSRNTVTQPGGPTNANGVATGTLSSTEVGTKTVSATANATALTQTATVTVTPAVFVGAGDIAACTETGDEATALLLDGIPGTVFTAGDNAYESGTAEEFANCYDPSWGRHKARTRPSPGNHDYRTTGAAPYYAYFGDNAGPAGRGYYSYDLGAWHIISLNSNIKSLLKPGSAQDQWLRADLAANSKLCTLAYWHHARFSSGTRHGSDTTMQHLWQALYEYGADVVIVGHDHTYERFAPQTPDGTADPVRGIRQFVVGTGGKDLYGFGPLIANSEAQNRTAHGVLKLTLHATSYEWQFIPIAGQTFTDTGSDSCH
jgi:protocatechuate 3,4-dioxygenase beta subunit